MPNWGVQNRAESRIFTFMKVPLNILSRYKTSTLLRCWVIGLLLVFGFSAQAQRGIGFRFGTDFDHFFRADQHPLVNGWWSHLMVGTYYQAYFHDGGAQLGINLLYKNNDDKGFPNFPVVQRDWRKGQNIGLTALEADLKVGPRFGLFNPKIGAQVMYCFQRTGFLEAGDSSRLNRVFLTLPFGLSLEGPTGYGSVGFGAFYNIGLNNIIKAPTPGLRDYDGSKLRGLRFEFTIVFASGQQKEKHPPKIYDPETGEEIKLDQ
jgi:hypothetical protein